MSGSGEQPSVPRHAGVRRLSAVVVLLVMCFLAGVAPAYAGAPGFAVFRFYNAGTGAHLYTRDANEFLAVSNNPAFQSDGMAYYIWAEFARTPLHRFYHMQNGVHFYTADASEAARVQTTMAGTYRYEGVAYNVGGYGLAVHRFLNLRTGVHFYSADAAEVANVQANLSSIYRYEGIAFYAPQSSFL